MSTTSRAMTLAAAALALSMAGGALAQGRPGDSTSQLGPEQRRELQQQINERGSERIQRGAEQRRDLQPQRDDRGDYRDGRQFDRRATPQPHAEWRRGGRVPTEYRGRGYVVDDWRGHRLQQPPRGYQWIGLGGDFVLAAIATGLIAQIVTSQ